MKKIMSSKLGFLTVAVAAIWLKSYLIYLYEFNLDIQNGMQQFLLFFNPLSSALIFLGLAMFFKGRRAGLLVIIFHGIMSSLLYANVVFYRFNTDFITIPTLSQTGNFGSLGGSIASLVEWHDLLYGLDILLLIVMFLWTKPNWSVSRTPKRQPMLIMMAGMLAFMINLGLAEADRPQLLERTFDRTYIVKYLGAYNFTIYDALQNVKSSTQRVLADSSDITEVENYTKNKYAEPNEEMFGAGEGKNVIKIHLESFQSFLIDYKLHGEEVTPFLNSIVNDQSKDFTYFENFFHQTEQGKTADAEFTMDNSLYGLPTGAAFVIKGNNTYQSLPAIMSQEQDYTSAVMHGDNKSFWNRDEIYKSFGIDEFYSETDYNMSEDKTNSYGLHDKPFFEESEPYLKSLADSSDPFYAHLITLTHHHPYMLDEEDATIAPAETGDPSVDRYFQTARYLDESLEQFFKELKEDGLYEDSIIMMYGDHYGISDKHDRAMTELLGEEITNFKQAQLQRVPLMIKVPGVDGKGTVEEYGGQMDVMPTLLHLLGIDSQDYIQFGTDLFSDDHKEFVPFRNGDFITPDYSKVSGKYYDNDSGEEIEPTEDMKEKSQSADRELELSDQVLYGDLLRFYEPNNDWQPVDRSNYHYGDEDESEDDDRDADENVNQ